MDIQNLRDSKAIVEKVEEALQTAYSTNQDFNSALDEAEPWSFQSLREPEHAYLFKPSEALYWIERDSYLNELEYWEAQKQAEQHVTAVAYIKSSDQEPVFLDLVEALRNRRVAPFIGAGLSRACGYPMWGEALRKMAQKFANLHVRDIEPFMSRYDYLGAAQVLFDAAEDRVRQFIKTEFRQNGNLTGPIQLLPDLAPGCIVTTNFDTVIEDVFKERGQPLDGYMHGTQAGHNFVQRLLRGERCILKLHGDAGQGNSHVFTQAQYTVAYGEPLDFKNQLPKALRQIFITHSLLFLGYSLEQDKTLELFQTVVDEGAFEIPDHFALMNLPQTSEERAQKEGRLLKLKIQPLWYETPQGPDGRADHSLLEQILRLAVAVARGQAVVA